MILKSISFACDVVIVSTKDLEVSKAVRGPVNPGPPVPDITDRPADLRGQKLPTRLSVISGNDNATYPTHL